MPNHLAGLAPSCLPFIRKNVTSRCKHQQTAVGMTSSKPYWWLCSFMTPIGSYVFNLCFGTTYGGQTSQVQLRRDQPQKTWRHKHEVHDIYDTLTYTCFVAQYIASVITWVERDAKVCPQSIWQHCMQGNIKVITNKPLTHFWQVVWLLGSHCQQPCTMGKLRLAARNWIEA